MPSLPHFPVPRVSTIARFSAFPLRQITPTASPHRDIKLTIILNQPHKNKFFSILACTSSLYLIVSSTSVPQSLLCWSPVPSSPSPPRISVQLFMEPTKQVYSVWGLPPEDVTERLKKLMFGLRSEFGGPEFEPHVTVVGSIELAEDDAREKFQTSCQGLKAYTATVEKVATGTFFYQCVFLLLHPQPQVVETSDHCCSHFGYKRPSTYMPHLSILYGDLTDEEKKKAQEKANSLDGALDGLTFQISRLALYETDTEDKTLKSWKKVAECNLEAN
ncbi:hypothetical protein NMG60_11012906 [Bertholletia excelsa]